MGLKSYLSQKIFGGKPQIVETRASDSIVKDTYFSYFRGSVNANAAPTGLSVLLDLYEKDPIVNTAINVRTNAILASGFSFEGSKTAVRQAEDKLRKAGVNNAFLDQMVKQGLLYNHVFIELAEDGKELYLLEPAEMEIKHDKHGTIEGYRQRSVTGEVVDWTVDQIVYIPFNKITNRVWGSVNLKTLYRTATTKNLIEEFLSSLAITNAWRQVFKTKTMQQDTMGEFIAYLRDAQADPTMPLIIKTSPTADKDDGVFELLRDPSDLKEFLGLLEYLTSQMLMELRTPPILVGLPDNSNRSNSDSQFKAFNVDNEAFRKLISDAFNYDLFKKLGLTAEFSWNPIDKRSEKDDVEMAEKLMNMGAKPSQVEAFLRKSGLDLPEGELFEPRPSPMETFEAGKQASAMKTPDDAASRPSRQREDKSREMKSVGTGRDSSTKQSQIGG
jgi:hypothetical protein